MHERSCQKSLEYCWPTEASIRAFAVPGLRDYERRPDEQHTHAPIDFTRRNHQCAEVMSCLDGSCHDTPIQERLLGLSEPSDRTVAQNLSGLSCRQVG